MSNINNYKFRKEEKIVGENRIDSLFIEGKSFVAFPLRVVYLKTELSLSSPLSVLVSVPKKRIKSAVKRNRIKRQVREAYRLNKHYLEALTESIDHHLDIAFVFVRDELMEYSIIEKGMRKGLTEIANRLSCNKKE